jgi:hypothetical protein
MEETMTRSALSFLLVIAAFLTPSLPASGEETLPVGPDVPVGEPCEPKGPQTVPCSLQAAIKVAAPGSRLELLGGVYGCLAISGLHGMASLPIVVQPAAGASVIFSCSDAGVPATISIRDSSYLTFRGFGVVNAAERPFVLVTNSLAVSFEECTWGDASSWSVSPAPARPSGD